MRLGTDLIEINRIQHAIERSERFHKRVYTSQEIAYCESKHKGMYQSMRESMRQKRPF